LKAKWINLPKKKDYRVFYSQFPWKGKKEEAAFHLQRLHKFSSLASSLLTDIQKRQISPPTVLILLPLFQAQVQTKTLKKAEEVFKVSPKPFSFI
jgi:hypothetical protein